MDAQIGSSDTNSLAKLYYKLLSLASKPTVDLKTLTVTAHLLETAPAITPELQNLVTLTASKSNSLSSIWAILAMNRPNSTLINLYTTSSE
jgi:hypothetical protein